VEQTHRVENTQIVNVDAQKTSLLKSEVENQMISEYQAMYTKGMPLSGTLGETYFKRQGITQWPDLIRFGMTSHPDNRKMTPSILCPSVNRAGDIVGLERIFLDKEGKPLNQTQRDMLGKVEPLNARHMRIWGEGESVIQHADAHRVFVVQGLEKALQVAQTHPHDRVISVTSFQDKHQRVAISSLMKEIIFVPASANIHAPKQQQALEQNLSKMYAEHKSVKCFMEVESMGKVQRSPITMDVNVSGRISTRQVEKEHEL
jgi:hypothetical protein